VWEGLQRGLLRSEHRNWDHFAFGHSTFNRSYSDQGIEKMTKCEPTTSTNRTQHNLFYLCLLILRLRYTFKDAKGISVVAEFTENIAIAPVTS
jgi:hypothetical protein